jgi:phenylacetate-coenzyme A ligase PaaK-like adenylate-forming protein
MTDQYLDPEIETATPARRREFQTERLREQVEHAYANSAFYARKFDVAGVRPGQIRSHDDLKRLPFTTKDELRANQAMHPPWGDILGVPVDECVRLHLTSGTTGRPLAVMDTASDWSGFHHMYARSLWAMGVRPSDIVMPAFSFGPWIGYWAGFYAAQELGCLVLPTGGMSTEQRIDALLTYGVTVVGCTPSYALHLAECARQLDIDLPARSSVRITWHTGEPGASIPSTKPCPCGRTFTSFDGGVLGRLDDMKKIRGVIVYPTQIEEVIRARREIEEYRIIFRRVHELDEIIVQVEPRADVPNADSLTGEFVHDLRLALGIRTTVELVPVGSLPRWEQKARRIVDEREEVPF